MVLLGIKLSPIEIGLLGQENTTLTELLKEAREKVYTQPEQTQKISAYILKQTENDLVKAEAFFLLSRSEYTQGKLDQAVKNILRAEELATTYSGSGL